MKKGPRTFVLTLPDGKKVRCLIRDQPKIREDVATTGTVMLREIKEERGVYERVDPHSNEALDHVQVARHVT